MLTRRTIVSGVTGLVAASTTPAWAATPAFQLTSLALYLPEVALRQRGPDTESLTAFIHAIVAAANAELSRGPGEAGCCGSLVVGMKPPAKSRFWVVMTDKGREASLQGRLKRPLEDVPPPEVRGWNAVAINFDAWGGDGTVHQPAVSFPDEWLRAVPQGGGIVPDSAFEVIWRD
jgi:hypothetical protein